MLQTDESGVHGGGDVAQDGEEEEGGEGEAQQTGGAPLARPVAAARPAQPHGLHQHGAGGVQSQCLTSPVRPAACNRGFLSFLFSLTFFFLVLWGGTKSRSGSESLPVSLTLTAEYNHATLSSETPGEDGRIPVRWICGS